jgi:hypothetical protein
VFVFADVVSVRGVGFASVAGMCPSMILFVALNGFAFNISISTPSFNLLCLFPPVVVAVNCPQYVIPSLFVV